MAIDLVNIIFVIMNVVKSSVRRISSLKDFTVINFSVLYIYFKNILTNKSICKLRNLTMVKQRVF
jgi:hypothetical protein